jgi:hypothetical protein
MRRIYEDYTINVSDEDGLDYDFSLVKDKNRTHELYEFIKRLKEKELMSRMWVRQMDEEDKMLELSVEYNNLIAFEILRQNNIGDMSKINLHKIYDLCTFTHILYFYIERYGCRELYSLAEDIYWEAKSKIKAFYGDLYLEYSKYKQIDSIPYIDNFDKIYSKTLERKFVILSILKKLPKTAKPLILKFYNRTYDRYCPAL